MLHKKTLSCLTLLGFIFLLIAVIPNVQAVDIPKFGVFAAVGCTATTVMSDADCWSLTSGGLGGFLPDGDDSLVIDANSGALGAQTGITFTTTGSFTITATAPGSFTITTETTFTVGNAEISDQFSAALDAIFVTNDFHLFDTGFFNLQEGSVQVGGNFIQDREITSTEGCLLIFTGLSDTTPLWSGTAMQLNECGFKTFDAVTVLTINPSDDSFSTGRNAENEVSPATWILPAGKTWTINTGIDAVISGDVSAVLTLQSSIPGTRWNLAVPEDDDFPGDSLETNYVSVSDSDASLSALCVDATDPSNNNDGNNLNWNFGEGCLTSTVSTSCETLTNSTGLPFNVLILILVGSGLTIAVVSAYLLVGKEGFNAKTLREWLMVVVSVIVILLFTGTILFSLGC